MVIELFGLPASGKTTLAKLISDKKGWEVIKIKNRAELLWHNFLFLICHPIKFFALLGWLIRYTGHRKLFYFKLMNFFFDVNARYQKARLRGNAILDQGYFQNLLSIFESHISLDLLRKYIKILPKPDMLMVLNTPLAERENRVKERGYFAREKMGESYREHWKSSVEANFSEFIKILPPLGLNSQIINASQAPEEIYSKIKLLPATKIIYITNVRLPTEKAHGLQIMKSCEAFAGAGASVELVAPLRFTHIKEDPFVYYRVRKNFKLRKIFSLDLFPLSFVPKRLAFYVQSLTFSLMGLVCAILKQKGGIVFYSRDYATLFLLALFGFRPVAEIHDYRSRNPKWFIKLILKKTRIIILNSEGTLNALKNHYDLDMRKVLVAPNGVDVEFFDIKETRDEAREKLRLPKNIKILGYVGSLRTVGQDKGVSGLINAFENSLEERDTAILYVVGGPDNLLDEYKGLARSRNVIFTGHVKYERIPLYLRAFDAVIIPLLPNNHGATTSPIKLFEFMAAGQLIISSDLSSLKHYLNKNNSLLFKAGDWEDLEINLKNVISGHDFSDLKKQILEDAKNHSWDARAAVILNKIV